MKHEPQIQQRAAQPYVGIRTPVTMKGLAGAVDTGFPEVFGWLAKRGVAPAGPPFIRYLVIDMETELEIELAVPVGGEVEGGGRVRSDVLPAGRYVTLRHVGPFDGLAASNAALQRWPRSGALRWTAGTPIEVRPRAVASNTSSRTYRRSPTRRSGRSRWRTTSGRRRALREDHPGK